VNLFCSALHQPLPNNRISTTSTECRRLDSMCPMDSFCSPTTRGFLEKPVARLLGGVELRGNRPQKNDSMTPSNAWLVRLSGLPRHGLCRLRHMV
jgi:hypothetical protein